MLIQPFHSIKPHSHPKFGPNPPKFEEVRAKKVFEFEAKFLNHKIGHKSLKFWRIWPKFCMRVGFDTVKGLYQQNIYLDLI